MCATTVQPSNLSIVIMYCKKEYSTAVSYGCLVNIYSALSLSTFTQANMHKTVTTRTKQRHTQQNQPLFKGSHETFTMQYLCIKFIHN